MINLFKGYKACKDKAFLSYIQQIENAHEDGTTTITPDRLMNRAGNYYKKRLEDPANKWEEPDSTEAELLAVQAEVKRLKSQGTKHSKKVQVQLDKKKKASPKKSVPKLATKPEWLTKQVKPKDPKEQREWNGHTWIWCDKVNGGKCKGAWGNHKPSECRGDRGGSKRKSDPQKSSRKSRTKKMIKAEQALVENESDSSSHDSSD